MMITIPLINEFVQQKKRLRVSSCNSHRQEEGEGGGRRMKRQRTEEEPVRWISKEKEEEKMEVETESILLAMIQIENSLLYHICFELRHSVDDLEQFYNFLMIESGSRPWLENILSGGQFHDIWFIVFKYTYPMEIIYTYEYDYIVRHPTTILLANTNHYCLAYQIESLISSSCRLCHYVSKNGVLDTAREGISGEKYYIMSDCITSIERLMRMNCYGCGYDDYVSLSVMEPGDIKVYHIKMRRIMLLMIKEIAKVSQHYFVNRFQNNSPIVGQGENYEKWNIFIDLVNSCKNLIELFIKKWDRDKIYLSDDIKCFFVDIKSEYIKIYYNRHENYPLNEYEQWREMITRIIKQVDEEIVYPNDSIFVNHFYEETDDVKSLITKLDKYDFIYKPSIESRNKFRERLLCRNSNLPIM